MQIHTELCLFLTLNHGLIFLIQQSIILSNLVLNILRQSLICFVLDNQFAYPIGLNLFIIVLATLFLFEKTLTVTIGVFGYYVSEFINHHDI